MTDDSILKTPQQTQRERRLQTWLLGGASTLLVMFVGWASGQFFTLIKQSNVNIYQQQVISAQIALLYSASDAHRDFTETNSRIDANTHRVESMEGRQQNFDLRLDRFEHAIVPRASK